MAISAAVQLNSLLPSVLSSPPTQTDSRAKMFRRRGGKLNCYPPRRPKLACLIDTNNPQLKKAPDRDLDKVGSNYPPGLPARNEMVREVK